MFLFPSLPPHTLQDITNASHSSDISRRNHGDSSLDDASTSSRQNLKRHTVKNGSDASGQSGIYNASKTSSKAGSDAMKSKTGSKNSTSEESDVGSGAAETSVSLDTKNDWSNGVKFINRPHGTPLFTITEQRSLATLRSKPSNLTFTLLKNQLQSTKKSNEVHIEVQKIDCERSASVDDLALSHLRWIQAKLISGSSHGFGSSTSEEAKEQVNPWSAVPPFPAPGRVRTPEVDAAKLTELESPGRSQTGASRSQPQKVLLRL